MKNRSSSVVRTGTKLVNAWLLARSLELTGAAVFGCSAEFDWRVVGTPRRASPDVVAAVCPTTKPAVSGEFAAVAAGTGLRAAGAAEYSAGVADVETGTGAAAALSFQYGGGSAMPWGEVLAASSGAEAVWAGATSVRPER